MKTCEDCKTEIQFGLICQRCAGVDNVLLRIRGRWSHDEMATLRDKFREGGLVKDLRAAASENNAAMLAGVYHAIQIEANTSDTRPEEMMRKVANAITTELTAQEQIAKHDKENGEGTWNRRCVGYVQRAMTEAFEGKRQPTS